MLDHARHDRGLVAAYAAHDLAGRELARAEALVTSCPHCAELAADLRAIAAASRSDAALTARAPRDFRITPEVAARARRRSIGELLATLVGRDAAARRPLGAAVATLGLVGVLIFGIPLGPFLGMGTAGSARDAANPNLVPAGEAVASAAPPPAPTTPSKAYDARGNPIPASSGAAGGAAGGSSSSPFATPSGGSGSGINGYDAGGHGEKAVAPSAFDVGGPGRAAIGIGSMALVAVGALLALVPSRRRRRS